MSETNRVLVVDDEPNIVDVISMALRFQGFVVESAGTGADALGAVSSFRPDLIVLDVMLPGLGGIEVLRQLGAAGGPRTPVILLTAKGEQGDKLVGLRSGADDYVVKPFSPKELVARVDAVLRRALPDAAQAEPLRYDGLEIDVRGRRVTARGGEAHLSQREFDLLQFIASHPGQVFTRDQLLDNVWEPAFRGDPGTVTVHVRRLRTKIEPDPERPRFIQTVWGVGYRFRP
jgi:two-component system, OmpR family, response regulator ResD